MSTQSPLRVAIIGSGPAAFYAAEALLKQQDVPATVDMFDRLPTPYGLVRGGVAPDHQSIKAVIRVYERTAARPGFRFFGNVTFGRDLRVEDISQLYHQVVYGIGNEESRRLSIPGHDLAGCIPAASFVGWYNGHPDFHDLKLDLSVDKVAVIGNGNVAVDVARILARTPEELASTDIADHALEALRGSAVKDVYLLGRRGPVQAAFTPQELKEFGKLAAADPIVDRTQIELDKDSEAALEQAGKQVKRNVELLREFAHRGPATQPRRVHFRFLVSPTEIGGAERGGQQSVARVRLERNRLVLQEDGSLRPRGTGEYEELEVGMVVPAIGFRGVPLPDVPFDEARAVIQNDKGRVTTGEGQTVPGAYAVGWAQSGPRGLIGSNKAPSEQVAALMLEDWRNGHVPARDLPPADTIHHLLESRQVRALSYADWQRLDKLEQERGAARGAPRNKFTRIPDMLAALESQSSG